MSVSLRELQLCELEVLKTVKSVCDKHQIRCRTQGTLQRSASHVLLLGQAY